MQGKPFEVELNERCDIAIKICILFLSRPSISFPKVMQGSLDVDFGFGVTGICNKVEV